jgi:hypothetical protein
MFLDILLTFILKDQSGEIRWDCAEVAARQDEPGGGNSFE